MNTETMRASIDRIIAEARTIQAELFPPPPSVRLVRAGESLQAALDAGGAIETEPGARFAGSFAARSSTTLTFGEGSGIDAPSGSALRVPPGTSHVRVAGGVHSSADPNYAVIEVGENSDNQTRVEDAPGDIQFVGLAVPTYRGKRVFALHGRGVLLKVCTVTDVWDPAGRDSQAVWIGNAPGNIRIEGGLFSAGSECILGGGPRTMIPGLVPTGIRITGAEVMRPLSWQTDGMSRKVKNLIEFKSGRQVVIRQCRLSGSWHDGQDGWAIVLTPALDSQTLQPSGEVRDVLVEDCDIRNVGSIFQMIGRAYVTYTENPLTNVVVRRNRFATNRTQFGGFGQLAKVGGEPGSILFEENIGDVDGSSLFYYYRGTIMQQDGVKRAGGMLGALGMRRNYLRVGSYGLNLDGIVNAQNWQAAVGSLDVTNNVFGGSTAMRTALPNNEYLSLEDWRARVATQE